MNVAHRQAVLATAIPSVCLSIRPSVTRWYPIETNEDRIMRSSRPHCNLRVSRDCLTRPMLEVTASLPTENIPNYISAWASKVCLCVTLSCVITLSLATFGDSGNLVPTRLRITGRGWPGSSGISTGSSPVSSWKSNSNAIAEAKEADGLF